MDDQTRAKVKAFRWYVSFANMELETIQAGDRAKLLIEAEEHLFPGGK